MEIFPQLLVNALITGSIYALASSGLSLSYGLLHILNFSHGHMIMLGTYFFYSATVILGWHPLLAGLTTLTACALLSCLTLKVFILPFSKYSTILTVITTLALANIIESTVSIIFGIDAKLLTAGSSAKSIEMGPVYMTPIQIVLMLITVALLSGITFLVHGTPLGRRIRSVSENEDAAQSLGISRVKISYGVFALATVLAAYSGILIGYETSMQPTMGSAYMIKSLAAIVMGGLGNIGGTIAGSYILALVENLSIGMNFGEYSIPAGYRDSFSFLIILLVLLFRPQGIFRARKRVI